jgi:hypothetical protein
MKTFRFYCIALFISLAFSTVNGDLIGQTSFTATYTFGSYGNVASFAYNGTSYAGISPGNIVKVGVTSTSNKDNFRANDWPLGATDGSNAFTGSVDIGKYIGFTIDAVTGYKFTITSISFGIGRSATGTRQSQWRGSADSYGSILDNYTTLNSGLSNTSGVLLNPDTDGNWSGNVLTLGSSYENIVGSAGFRYYLYNTEGTSGTAGLQGPITISGTFEEFPTILLSTANLSGFYYYEGDGPSAEQSFTVEGVNLTNDVSIAATTNYEISKTSGSGFTSGSISFTLAEVSTPQNVYVRLKAGLTNATYNAEVIEATSTGADMKSLTCNGTVYKAAPTTQASAITFTAVGTNQISLNWTSGNGDKRIVIMNNINHFTDPANGSDPIANTVYGGIGQQVIYNDNINSVTVTALTHNTSYWFRVYEYNNSGSNTQYNVSTATDNPNSQKTTVALWEDFETGSNKTSYASGNATFATGEWVLNDALCTTGDASDKKNGTRSVRIRSAGTVSMNFDLTNGLGTVDIHHAKYGTDGESTWRLEVSNNGGSSWNAFTSSVITTDQNTLTKQSFTVNVAGNVRFRIVKLSGGGNRINIDDISVTNYYSPTNQASNLVWETLPGNKMGFSWNPGNGSGNIFLMKAGSAPANPAHGTTYTANSNFGSAPGLSNDAATKVVFFGSTSSKAMLEVEGLNTSTTYYFKVLEYTGTGSETTYNYEEAAGFNVGNSDGSALPVELLLFAGQQKADRVELSWQTATETNNAGFEVERSENAKDFEMLGMVAGAGNSNMIQYYNFTDYKPLSSTAYYRLKQVDYDGAYEYSPIVAVALQEDETGINSISAENGILRFHISGMQGESLIRIFDISGRIVYSKSIITAAAQECEILLPNLSKGLYMMNVYNDGKQKNVKFVLK